MIRNKKGFTLVELLAVIVILAIILVIAVPKITKTIDETRNGAFISSAKLIAASAEKKNLENETLGIEQEIECKDLVELTNDYKNCDISFDENKQAYVTIIGDGKFKGKQIVNGTKNHATVIDLDDTSYIGDHKLTLDGNGITIDPSEITVTYDAKYSNLPTPTRVGYKFIGWFIGDTEIKNGDKVLVGEDTTATAKWEAISYTINYELNDGTLVTNKPETAKFDDILIIGNPEKEGYDFIGWTISGLNTETAKYGVTEDTVVSQITSSETKIMSMYFKSLTAEDNGNITLTANYAEDEYTISFNVEGGTVNPSEITVKYNDTYKDLPIPTKDGYTFAGWFIDNTEIKNGDKVIITGNASLTAKWTVNTYTISYVLNGGTKGTNAPTTGIFDSVLTIDNPTKEGYTFAGWTISGLNIETAKHGVTEDTVVSQITSSETKIMSMYFKNLTGNANGTVTLTANYTADEHTLTLKPNGGTVTKEEINVTYDEFYLGLPTPEKEGYTFVGWFIGDIQIKNGDKVTITGNATATANWTANTYTIKYELNSGTAGTNAPTTGTYDANVTISNPTRAGYTFAGWTITGYDDTARHGTSTNAITSTIASTTTKIKSTYFKNLRTTSGTVTLTANWTANTYTISYVLNSGTAGTNAPTSGTYNSNVTISNPTRAGYTFTGWTITGYDDTARHGTSTSAITSTIASTTTKIKSTYFKNLRTTSGTVTLTANWEVLIGSEYIDSLYKTDANYHGLKSLNGIRYEGTNPKNYVWFECSDKDSSNRLYGHESYSYKTACTLWRIIGAFDGKLKIVRAKALSTTGMAWDSSSPYSNLWENSEIEAYLNDTYYNGLSTQSKNQIGGKSQWYTGKVANGTVTNVYVNEKEGATIQNYIGLIYPSDFGYAGSDCTDEIEINNNNCGLSNNWLTPTSGENYWTMSPEIVDSTMSYAIISWGSARYTSVSNLMGVRPSLYLDSSVKIVDGTGISEDPYVLGN